MTRSSNRSTEFVNPNAAEEQALLELIPLEVKKVIQQGIQEYLLEGMRLFARLLMQAEVTNLCGKRYEHDAEEGCHRWGSQRGTVVHGGTKESVERPRVRRKGEKKTEVSLESYAALNKSGALSEQVVNNIVAGVSTRKYASTVEKHLRKHGISKSAVSRHAIKATKPVVEAFLKRPLEELNLIAMFFDGINIGKRQVIACIGISGGGKKYVLGVKPGATENERVCRDLLRELKDRGLKEDKPYLFVIDGSKALSKAIKAAFGDDVAIQRCQEHKIRDVQAYLPFKLRESFRSRLQAAWNQKTEKQALDRLSQIRSELLNVSEQAANSLTEGMRETVTLHRLGITGELRTSLRTTNVIESAFSSVRRLTAKPTRYRNEAQIVLWLGRGLHEAEKNFRPIKGNRQLTSLRKALNKSFAKRNQD